MQLSFLDFEVEFDFPHRGRLLTTFRVDGVPKNSKRTVDQCLADIILTPSGCPLTDLEYADDLFIFSESRTKLHRVANLVLKLAAAYGLRLHPYKCKQM
ncbi:hypothetical protein RB195_015225 [Necator americanus]|uniref:Reverse transcriptase domain-containing protein n=1 Tax=Necator americanus TaxID=51031 RepID=A0ABR1E3J9_NECAM